VPVEVGTRSEDLFHQLRKFDDILSGIDVTLTSITESTHGLPNLPVHRGLTIYTRR